MKKLVLSVVLAATVIGANAGGPVKAINFTGGGDGVNTKGKIHLGLGYGMTLGGAKLNYKDDSGELKMTGAGINGNYGLRVGYGVTDAISAGIFLRRHAAVYTFTSDDGFGGAGEAVSGFAFGVEAKYHLVNKEKFALYLAPTVGFGTAKFVDDTEGETGKGLNFGLNAGLNWYWTDFIGMSFDLGYGSNSFKFKEEETTVTLKNSGVYFGFGLVSKFGGN